MMTNTQAQAYAVLALRELGLDRETVSAVEREMYRLFDLVSEEEAEEKVYGIKRGMPVCECCGSKNDVAGIALVLETEIELCQECRTTWFQKARYRLHDENIEGRGRDQLIQLIRDSC